ncbi:MAG: translocation/assembly module TamB domain-containing protein [Rhodobacteraceae bacterium]|nr:translocation/assembly module TamB domain-containing protein [Paracoccaceae bacterium]
MKHLAAFLLIFLLPLSVAAQGVDENDDGPGYLAGLLQSALSGSGRDVQIRGFQGALSSRATLARLTIADRDGVWLSLENAALDWNRAALLRGAVEVRELTAERIEVLRPPVSEETLPDPEAGGFRIPELPVSVSIGRIATGDLVLGAPVLGTPVALTLEGAAELGDAVRVAIEVQRTDGRQGDLDLDLSYDRQTGQLTTRLALVEESAGLVAGLLDLPGQPALALRVDGAGPVTGFTATLALDTDGRRRLDGEVTLTGRDDGATAFRGDLGGDLSALLLPQAQAFFGPDIRLGFAGENAADTGLNLTSFDLTAAALDLRGALRLDPEGRPVLVDVTGRVGDGRDPVDLPFGTGLRLTRADLNVRYDAADGAGWQLDALARDLVTPGVSLPQAAVTGRGALDLGQATRFAGRVDLTATADFDDPALARALGRELRLGSDIIWQSGDPVRLDDFRYDGATVSAQGAGAIRVADGGVAFDGQLRAETGDLGAFSLIAGLPGLGGAASASISGRADILAGAFDLTIGAQTRDLALGIDRADPFLGGVTRFDTVLARGATGLQLDRLSLTNAALDVDAAGALSSSAGDFRYDAVLRGAGRALDAAGGDLKSSGRAVYDGRVWRIDGDGTLGPVQSAQQQIDALLREGARLAFAARLQDDAVTIETLDLSNRHLRVSAQGALAPAIAMEARVELPDSGVLAGVPGGPARLNLTARDGAHGLGLTLTGEARDLATGVPQADALLAGRIVLDARALLAADGAVRLQQADLSGPAIELRASGPLAPALELNAQLALPRSGVLLGTNGGPAVVNASVAALDAGLRLRIAGHVDDAALGVEAADALLRGRTAADVEVLRRPDGSLDIRRADIRGSALTASVTGQVAGAEGTADLSLSAALDDVGRLTSTLSGPLSAQGRVRGRIEAPRFDVSATGPGGATVRGAGQLGLPGGAVEIDASGEVPLALLDAVLGTRSIAGQSGFEIALRGQPAVENLTGRVTLADARFFDPALDLSLTGLRGSIDLARGQAQVTLRGNVDDGTLAVDGPIGLAAPFRSDLRLALRSVPVAQDLLFSTRVSGDLAIGGALTGQNRVSGAVVLDQTELRIPSSLGGQAEPIPDINHRGASAAVRASQARAGLIGGDSAGGGAGGGSSTTLDLTVSSGDPMFLRGRGIDAELAGSVRMAGALDDIRAQGQFNMTRGRMTLLGQRLDFSQGRVTFAGSLLPQIYLEAVSEVPDYVITIVIAGPASSPEVSFSATPDLPDDEVLAQLFFSRPVAELSAFQAARLAAGVAELAGDGSPGLMDNLRAGLGVDDLDISTAADGETALRAGKYISDNVYTDVEITSGGNTSVSINLDLTPDVVVKGSADSRGQTGIGVFFERDY